jgi:adenine-specific DNA glycosylase
VTGPLAGLWRFPSAEADRPETARSALAEELAVYGLELGPEPALGEARHAIMNRRISIRVYAAKPARAAEHGAGARWMSPGELERAAIPTLTRKISAAAGLS